MSFADVLNQQKEKSGEGSQFKAIRDSQFSLGGRSYIKFFPDTVRQVFEVWLRPSDNLPDNATEDTTYCFKVLRINNDKTRDITTLARAYGSPEKWKVNDKNTKYVDNGLYKGGILEFKYSEQRGADGKKKRIYKYLNEPQYKSFFDAFAYQGKPHKIDDYPKAPQLKYYIACAIHEDKWSMENKSYRWISITNSIFQQLASYYREGHDINKLWFLLEKNGEGLDTKYTLTPSSPEKSIVMNQSSLDDSFVIPDMELASQVSGAYYQYKFLKSYFIQIDSILKTNFTVELEKLAEASKPNENEENNQPIKSDDSSIPPEISSVINSDGKNDVAPSGILNDDDIPF
jgi:hypothetical protein